MTPFTVANAPSLEVLIFHAVAWQLDRSNAERFTAAAEMRRNPKLFFPGMQRIWDRFTFPNQPALVHVPPGHEEAARRMLSESAAD